TRCSPHRREHTVVGWTGFDLTHRWRPGRLSGLTLRSLGLSLAAVLAIGCGGVTATQSGTGGAAGAASGTGGTGGAQPACYNGLTINGNFVLAAAGSGGIPQGGVIADGIYDLTSSMYGGPDHPQPHQSVSDDSGDRQRDGRRLHAPRRHRPDLQIAL